MAAPLAAQQDAKFRVDGTRLIYDTENVSDDVIDSIEAEDVDVLLRLLRSNQDVTLLELNSTGGSLWASRKMSDIIIFSIRIARK